MTVSTIDEAELGLRELADEELAGVSGGLTVVEAVRNAVAYIASITYPNISCHTYPDGYSFCVRWGWQ